MNVRGSTSLVFVDLRPRDEFEKRHFSDSHSFPAVSFRERMFELPPRTRSLVLVIDDHIKNNDNESLENIIALIKRSAWPIVDILNVDKEDDIKTGIEILTNAQTAAFSKGGSSEANIDHSPAFRGIVSGPSDIWHRCWCPSPFLEDILPSLLGACGVMYDFGCGVGRDMAFAALHGWHVIGIDNRMKLLLQARSLHLRHSSAMISGTVTLVAAHLTIGCPFRPKSADCVLMIRFLCRELLPSMFEMCAVNGYFVASHFVDGVQHSRIGTPKTADGYLYHGELAAVCMKLRDTSKATFEILLDKETTLDDERPIVNFIAKRLN